MNACPGGCQNFSQRRRGAEIFVSAIQCCEGAMTERCCAFPWPDVLSAVFRAPTSGISHQLCSVTLTQEAPQMTMADLILCSPRKMWDASPPAMGQAYSA